MKVIKLVISDNINIFYTDLKLVNIEKIRKRMTLINSETFQVFIPKKIDIEDEFGKVIEIDGYSVWNEFTNLTNSSYNISFAEREIKLKNLMEYINYFTFSIYGKGIVGETPVRGIYYLNNSDLLSNGKIDRDFLEKNYSISK